MGVNEEINKAIKKGYTPIGGVSVVVAEVYKKGQRKHFYQAVIKGDLK